ncbi:MAG: thymidine phosphorylase [Kiritimatiellae bacterium]|nr:thymidine phosphorylase [Kiritimatiellia bacterium]
MDSFVPQWIIERKRDGQAVAEADLRELVARFTDGRLPEYQMAAFAMAVFFRGMTSAETLALTDAMRFSGDSLDWGGIGAPTADKHSTGGIGDKVSIPLAPLVAACGVAVPMISGRGLGITGGTLDKLESIPGYDAALSVERFRSIVSTVGCSIIGQTERLAPADRKLYALRDVTGTVPSIPLITASILSKKLAEGAGALVFDVKCGAGAFMKTREDALALAQSLVSVARGAGRGAEALVTAMDEPLGRTAGNALEIAESVEILRGGGPKDARALTLRLAAPMLTLTGVAVDENAAMRMLEEKLSSGAAAQKFAEMVAAHGGNAAVIDAPESVLPRAPVRRPVEAPRAGFVSAVDADAIGRAVLLLGGGRRSVSDAIDPAVGVSDIRKTGEHVSAGEPLLVVHARSEAALGEAMPLLKGAFSVSEEPVPARPLFIQPEFGP